MCHEPHPPAPASCCNQNGRFIKHRSPPSRRKFAPTLHRHRAVVAATRDAMPRWALEAPAREERFMKLKGIGGAVWVCASLAAMTMIANEGSRLSANDDDRDDDGYTIALFGDMPYNALGKSQYPALLADINRAHVAFSVHDGDLKSGGDGPCADSVYYTSIANFNKLERPLVWVPGDNDWTDCWGRYGPGTLPYS